MNHLIPVRLFIGVKIWITARCFTSENHCMKNSVFGGSLSSVLEDYMNRERLALFRDYWIAVYAIQGEPRPLIDPRGIPSQQYRISSSFCSRFHLDELAIHGLPLLIGKKTVNRDSRENENINRQGYPPKHLTGYVCLAAGLLFDLLGFLILFGIINVPRFLGVSALLISVVLIWQGMSLCFLR